MICKLYNYAQLLRLHKPIGTMLLLWPTLWALITASADIVNAASLKQWQLIGIFTVEVFLARSLGCVINDYFDAKFDRYVERTCYRPLAKGSISKIEALFLFISLALLAFVLAVSYLKIITIIMAIVALILLVSYPLAKRFFCLPQAHLALAFSFSIIVVYVEVLGHLTLTAWLLFAANYCWVFAYDTIYALMDIKDDLLLKIHSSAITLGKYVSLVIAIAYSATIALIGVVGILHHATFYYWLFLMVAALLLSLQVFYVSLHSKYLQMFKLNNYVGVIIYLALWQIHL